MFDPPTATWYLRNTNTTGCADVTFVFGPPHESFSPVVGDWDGDGRDTVGLYDVTACIWYLSNHLQSGAADWTFIYGVPGQGCQYR